MNLVLRRGVTLIEALIVVAIIGVMAAISFPAVASGLDSIRLRSASDSVASFLDAAMNRAERHQAVVEVVLDPKANRLAMYSTEPGFVRSLDLPQNIALAARVESRVLLIPNGTFPRFAVDLVSAHGARRRIAIDPVTSTPQITAVRTRPTCRGFTLLEVLVATMIMAIAVIGLLSELSTSMRNAARLSDHDRMAMLARTRMDELLADGNLPLEGNFNGMFDSAVTGGESAGYNVSYGLFESPQNAAANAAVLQRIVLRVWWKVGNEDSARQRSFTLEGFRRNHLPSGAPQS